jgi:predicted metallopeptidase
LIQAAAFHNLEQIEVVGAIVYMGTDSAAQQTSFLFGGSDLVRDALAANPTDVQEVLDNITTQIKSVCCDDQSL